MDIYVQKDGQRLGPYPESKVREGIDAGSFDPADLAWTMGKASWQPLSALISLDVTKPPPLHTPIPAQDSSVFTAVPVDLLPAQGHERKQKRLVPTNVSRPSSAPLKSVGPHCKVCGASYNRWSLFHKLGSGLCRKCVKTHVELQQPAIWQKEVKTYEDAYKVIRATAIYFVLSAVFNFCFGFIWMPIVVLCATWAIWHFHSRIAIALLIALIIVDYLEIFINAINGAAFFGMAIGAMIDSIGFWLCIRSWQAVGKLRTGFIQGS